MNEINIRNIQLHTYNATTNSTRTNQTYAEYAHSLHETLANYRQEMQSLKDEADYLLVWLRESQSLTLCIIQELKIKQLQPVFHHLPVHPQRLLDSLDLPESIRLQVAQNCGSTKTAVQSLWLSIIVWHLEKDYLTIFTTGFKQCRSIN